MTDFHDPHPFGLGGGLNLADAPERIDEDQAIELENVRFTGFGRWTFPRRALRQLFTGLLNPCGVHAMPHGTFIPDGETVPIAIGAVILDWTGTAVQLYVTDGLRFRKLIGTLAGWSSVGQKPVTLAAVMGSALWVCDEGRRHGLTCFDPLLIFKQPSALFQPVFKFEQNTASAAKPMRPRTVATYNNMLWAPGYGDEDNPDRPEILRHSYIGFTPDPQDVAGGDAAFTLNPAYQVDAEGNVLTPTIPKYLLIAGGVAGLFAVDDGFPVGTRGIPITGLKTGAERMIVGTRFQAFLLYGFDRDSFQLDLVDAERGVVNARAIGEADGIVYWWSALGPCRWGGQRVQALEREIQALVPEVDLESLWFLHQPTEYEARWYWGNGGPARSLDYNYRYNRWKLSRYGVPLAAGGTVQPGTILEPPQPGAPVAYPLVAPSGLTVRDLQLIQATAVWANGETGPEIVTDVEIKKASEAVFQPAGEESLGPGVDRFTYTLLVADTDYDHRVRHRNPVTGKESAWATGSFRTLSNVTLPGPTSLRVDLVAYTRGEAPGCVEVLGVIQVSWEVGGPALDAQVRRRRTDTGEIKDWFSPFPGMSDVGFTYRTVSANCPEKNVDDPFHLTAQGNFQPVVFSARHVRYGAGGVLAAISPWTDEVPMPPPFG